MMISIPSDLKPALESRLPETLGFLKELVAVNSFTANPAGVDANADRIVRQFAPLGFAERRIPCTEPGTGSHLILDSGGGGPAIACISHLDTVYPPEEELRNRFEWRRDGNRIFGPGTYDIKGGTALLWLMISTFAALEPETFRATRWILLWNAAEEILFPDFGKLCLETLPRSTRACLVMEGDNLPDDGFSLVHARKGRSKLNLRVTGRGAHAGSRHHEGANAIVQMARLIGRIAPLTDYDADTTVNVGTIEGGSVVNRVPHEARATLEIRGHDQEHYSAVRDQVLAMAGEGDVKAGSDAFPCRIEVELASELLPWAHSPGTERLLVHWKNAARILGVPLDAAARGGLSDANQFWQHFPTLDGLGPRGGNAHASERSADGTKLPEFVDADSFVPKAAINYLAVRDLLADCR